MSLSYDLVVYNGVRYVMPKQMYTEDDNLADVQSIY